VIETYVGVPGVTINVESGEELLEVVDLLHTQVMDNIGEDSPLLRVLEKCMNEIREIIDP
jgi:hypothetical protein